MNKQFLALLLATISLSAVGQKTDKLKRIFDEPIITDSASTLMIPTRYKALSFTLNKIVLGNEYYANIIFYNFKTDSYKRLFNEDTFIKAFADNNNFNYSRFRQSKTDNITDKWIFYFVNPTGSDGNGKIDHNAPSILFVSDKQGNGLKAITPANEIAVSIDVFDKQGFALIKMRRDLDKVSDNTDKAFYFVRLDLNTLTLGNKIEVSN